jgi:hypothetical protein
MILSASRGVSVSLIWVIYETFCLHVVSSLSFIPVICPKLALFFIQLSVFTGDLITSQYVRSLDISTVLYSQRTRSLETGSVTVFR